MSKLAILYFSAVGSTRVAAELLAERLVADLGGAAWSGGGLDHAAVAVEARDGGGPEVIVANIEGEGARALAEAADFLILLFPTYYLKPARPMRDFVAGLGRGLGRGQGRPAPGGRPTPTKPCYLIATCELYTENCLRRLAALVEARGWKVVGTKVLRAPGSDVTAVLPSRLVPWLFRYGRSVPRRLRAAAQEIGAAVFAAGAGAARGNAPARKVPHLRWYTPLTQLLQLLFFNHFDAFKRFLRLDAAKCSGCGACARECPGRALSIEGGRVEFDPERCILCCRCVHGCPRKAIALRRGMAEARRIDAALLGRLRGEARASLGLSGQDGNDGMKEGSRCAREGR